MSRILITARHKINGVKAKFYSISPFKSHIRLTFSTTSTEFHFRIQFDINYSATTTLLCTLRHLQETVNCFIINLNLGAIYCLIFFYILFSLRMVMGFKKRQIVLYKRSVISCSIRQKSNKYMKTKIQQFYILYR